MAGLIREKTIQEVRDKARIEDVVGQYVTLKRAGTGSLKGLCPFHDEKTPSFNVNTTRQFFHCLAGETRVLTREGAREIRELAGGTHSVLNRHGQWVEAPFKSYGVQRLHRITISRNRQTKELYATSGHRWFIRAGKSGQSQRELVTTELKAGDRLVPKFPRCLVSRTTPSPFGIAHGFTYGDGTRNGTGSMALLCPPKDLAMLKWFPNSHTSSIGDNLLVHHLPAFFKELPPRGESVSYLYGWLAGYFAADGRVAKDGTVMLNSADRSDLEFVRDVCTRLGIGTYGITTQLREGFPGRAESALHRIHFVNEDLTEEFFLLDEHRRRFAEADKQFARRGWVVESVEETDRVEEVYCAEVAEGHAFTLEDNILTGNCFGCQEGGDVIAFTMKIDALSFAEAVERLAEKYAIVLEREDGGREERPRGPGRGKLIEAHKIAAEFYADHLTRPDALAARQFLAERGFDRSAAEDFGLGFAPRDGDALFKHLRGRGFGQDELVTAGLVAIGRSAYDRFRGRLLWPIRDPAGDVIGFGARRIFDDDRIDAKYLNTPETPIYKKSQVLYGIDLARKEMGRTGQAVIVEGYTDVMACHLAGIRTAVASCGTAFGDDHARILRRFTADHEEFRGEVIFTFDGDEAGQAAAIKAFRGDQNFVSQTYVAVQPDGLDPCDLRIQQGDEAVRALIEGRVPLYRFVLSNVLERYDLDRADSRVDALREAARLVTSVRDRSKVDAFARELAGMVGVDVEEARREVHRAGNRRPGSTPARTRDTRKDRAEAAEVPSAQSAAQPAPPDPNDPRFVIERQTLKLAIQHPVVVGRTTAEIGPDDFTHPAYRAVWQLIAAAGGPAAGAGDAGWAARIRDGASSPALATLVSALTVEPLPSVKEPDAGYVLEHVVRLLELTTMRRIADTRSKLQRADPAQDPGAYSTLFGELARLEQHRRDLQARIRAAG